MNGRRKYTVYCTRMQYSEAMSLFNAHAYLFKVNAMQASKRRKNVPWLGTVILFSRVLLMQNDAPRGTIGDIRPSLLQDESGRKRGGVAGTYSTHLLANPIP